MVLLVNMDIEAQIEAILYFKAEPISFKELAKMLHKSEEIIRQSAVNLKSRLQGRGLAIIEESDSIELRTSKQASDLIQNIIKEEDSKELTKSALETLSIILYKGPIRRRDIDFIRGVNSSFILRTLSSRGLIRKTESTGRENIYEATTELLAHLGISNPADLPEYQSTKEIIEEKVGDLNLQDTEVEINNDA